MTSITSDSGTQPTPHYCTASSQPDGTAQGCPDWPECMFPPAVATAPDVADERDAFEALLAHMDRTAGPASERTLGQDLATLAGWAAGAVLVLVVAAVLLPLFL